MCECVYSVMCVCVFVIGSWLRIGGNGKQTVCSSSHSSLERERERERIVLRGFLAILSADKQQIKKTSTKAEK